MSTSTSTSARRTGTDGTRRTTVRPRCQARASATRSGNDAPAIGDRRLRRRAQRREPRDGGDPRGAQRRRRIAPDDQADVLLARQLRLAGGPPRAAAALHDPRRAGERGSARGGGGRDGDPVGEAGVVLRERAAFARPVLGGEVVPDHDVRVQPDHPAVPAEGLPGPRGPAGVLQHPVQVGQAQQVARSGCGTCAPGPRRPAGGSVSGRGEVRAPLPGSRDAVPHDDHRHVPAAGQAHEQLRTPPRHPVEPRPAAPAGRTAHPRASPVGPAGRSRSTGAGPHPRSAGRPRRPRPRWRRPDPTRPPAPHATPRRPRAPAAPRSARGAPRRRPGAAPTTGRAAPADPRPRTGRGRGGSAGGSAWWPRRRAPPPQAPHRAPAPARGQR